MQAIKVEDGQSLIEMSMQHTGLATNVIAIAVANDISITDELDSDLVMPIDLPTDNSVINSYKNENIVPATASIDNSFADIIADGELPEELSQYFEEEFNSEFFNY